MKSKSTANHWILVLGLFGIVACSETSGVPDASVDSKDEDVPTCPTSCATDQDCCEPLRCIAGICAQGSSCPSGCNYECDQDASEICNRATKFCEPGVAPINCINDCDCYADEACISGTCKPKDDEQIPCTSKDDCPADQGCVNQICIPNGCETREDCAAAGCLICVDNLCSQPPSICRVDEDCCLGYFCNFGSCAEVPQGCQSDEDCQDPTPRCDQSFDPPGCVPECINDIDCPLAGYICQHNECVLQQCDPDDCAQGQYCPQGGNTCIPGCDHNDDCVYPEQCNYNSHQCGQVDCCGGLCNGQQYCDSLTCQCITLCAGPADCPTNYNCDTSTGKCSCTDLACPAGSHCDSTSGDCVRDEDACDPTAQDCPPGYTCDPTSRVCIPEGGKQEGQVCFQDTECSAQAGLMCDNAFFVVFFWDSGAIPTYTCRNECAKLFPDCLPNQNCKLRKFIEQLPKFLCIPNPAP